ALPSSAGKGDNPYASIQEVPSLILAYASFAYCHVSATWMTHGCHVDATYEVALAANDWSGGSPIRARHVYKRTKMAAVSALDPEASRKG
ncbi:hypothetical protein Tco_0365502, partial [Tanacetum coccineum]